MTTAGRRAVPSGTNSVAFAMPPRALPYSISLTATVPVRDVETSRVASGADASYRNWLARSAMLLPAGSAVVAIGVGDAVGAGLAVAAGVAAAHEASSSEAIWSDLIVAG